MTTKAKNKTRRRLVGRRPLGRKPTAGTRRGAKRIPGPRATRLREDVGGTDGSFSEEGSWGQ